MYAEVVETSVPQVLELVTAGPPGPSGPTGPQGLSAVGGSWAIADVSTAYSGAVNRANINAALASISAGTVFIPGNGVTYDIQGRVVVASSKDLIGSGSSQETPAVSLRCVDSGSGITIGDLTGNGSSHGNIGGFTIDANNVAMQPLIIGVTPGATYRNIDIKNATPVGAVALKCLGTQNSVFIQVNLLNNYIGLRLDQGAATNTFIKCEIGDAKYRHIEFFGNALPIQGWTDPRTNTFYNCLVEYTNAALDCLIYAEAGIRNLFSDCTIVTDHVPSGNTVGIPYSSPPTPPVPAIIRLKTPVSGAIGCVVVLRDCDIGSNVSPGALTGIDIHPGAELVFSGHTAFNNLASVATIYGGSTVTPSGTIQETSIATTIQGPPFSAQVHAHRKDYMTRRSIVPGGQNSDEFWEDGNTNPWLQIGGKTLLIGPGNGAADIAMYRRAAGTFGVGDGFCFGLGVTTTAGRPSAAVRGAGAMTYDSTLSKLIVSDGAVWRDAMGTAV